MLYITQNSTNQLFVSVSEYKTLSSPTYLWVLQNAQSSVKTSFIPRNISNVYPSFYANKYDVFEFKTNKNEPEVLIASGLTDCNIHLLDNNQYWLGIYEQISPTNLNSSLSHDKLLSSLSFIFVNESDIYYTGDTPNNNVIYYGK
jgi:hypothetical protein